MISDVGDVPVGAAAAPANDGASAVAISVQALEPCSGGAREGNVGGRNSCQESGLGTMGQNIGKSSGKKEKTGRNRT